ncbi:MAG: tRNA 2-thiouridine(34) synthase MnmA [Chloroflexota bacterium]
MKKKRVVAAMSGGVDSSVAAALLLRSGYDVIGMTMQIWSANAPADDYGGCCSLAAVGDARRVCDVLGIPYYVVNLRDQFADKVIAYFVDEYRRGRTPNPCIACNRYLKWEALLQRALELEADYVATGHYARIGEGADGRRLLLRGLDRSKDQSYALYNLTQEQLQRTLLPLGGLTKTEVRRIAAEIGLAVADKPDSQEICFVHDNDYRRYLRDEAGLGEQPGPIIDTAGKRIGTHRGIAFYTVGQRRGLGIAAPEPLYVVELDPDRNAVIVGARSELDAAGLVASQLNWVAGRAPSWPCRATVKIRYNADDVACTISPDAAAADSVTVRFAAPQRAVAPGQAAVFYDGEVVLGGGVIDRKLRAEASA